MMIDSSLENSNYLVFTCSEVIIKSFKESLLTGVSKICYEEGRYNKLVRLFLLLLCVAGFCFNSWQFLLLYFSYPTYTVTTIVNEGDFPLPAFTFCNRSPCSRRVYCTKYRAECYHPEDMQEFCSLFPHYCIYNTDDFLIPENPIVDLENRSLLNIPPFFTHSETKNFDVSYFTYKRGFEHLGCTSTSNYGTERPVTSSNVKNVHSNQTINIRRNYLGTFSLYSDITDTLSIDYAPVVLLGIYSATEVRFSEFEIKLRSSYDVQIRLVSFKLDSVSKFVLKLNTSLI
ncbi:uncharacterized protein LOC129224317 [Uloborus diversus]|uniref:uncharacterized protein LOC129224317 n=1 Tax=Uloborus diversus TaxID=327109 RepID=UPI002409FB99|nr:uncharacterized protein LOC129224317 [Uloborus diversus]